jgi:hypothetical protein
VDVCEAVRDLVDRLDPVCDGDAGRDGDTEIDAVRSAVLATVREAERLPVGVPDMLPVRVSDDDALKEAECETLEDDDGVDVWEMLPLADTLPLFERVSVRDTEGVPDNDCVPDRDGEPEPVGVRDTVDVVVEEGEPVDVPVIDCVAELVGVRVQLVVLDRVRVRVAVAVPDVEGVGDAELDRDDVVENVGVIVLLRELVAVTAAVPDKVGGCDAELDTDGVVVGVRVAVALGELVAEAVAVPDAVGDGDAGASAMPRNCVLGAGAASDAPPLVHASVGT